LIRTTLNNRDNLAWLVAACALAIRLALVAWAGEAPETPLTGGSDTFAYQSLAESITNHRGLSYAGMPTALRSPLYPLLLAFGQFAAGRNYRLFVRLVQLLAGTLMASALAKTSEKLGGSAAIAFAVALAAPTLVFFSAEILSETLAALIVATFFFGAVIGLGMLERFNLAALAVVYVVYQFCEKKPSQAARHVMLGGLVAVAVVSPWFVRNLVTFHGRVLYSTHTGMNLLQGVITPDGRTQPSDTEKLKRSAGWVIQDIETNSVGRLAFPPEPELDRLATGAALAQLNHLNLFVLTGRKLGFFWLSFDQLFVTQSFSSVQRFERMAGVLAYWLLLGFGIAGWVKLRRRNPRAALLFAIYALTVTAMHLPFVMNTRIRAPFVEPALAILVGLAFTAIAGPPGISPGRVSNKKTDSPFPAESKHARSGS
jgi:hypothetical protein